jgi:hypothetical protein
VLRCARDTKRSRNHPASFAKNESVSEPESNPAGKFCVNAIAGVSRRTLSANEPTFAQSSRFVRKKRIVPRIEIGLRVEIFR